MDVERVVKRLQEEYPGKNIIKLPEKDPKEIICEVDPTSETGEYSRAVAVIDSSKPHRHDKSLEVYKILEGRLYLYIGPKTLHVGPGQSFQIKPGTIHSAIGSETWVEVESYPGWTPEDHILVDK